MVDDAEDEIISLTQALVRLETVNFGTPESGDEMQAAKLLRDKFAEDGIDSTIYAPRENRGNIAAQIGPGEHVTLQFMSHVDVVPAEDPAQWVYPPFSGEIADGRIWGRGASDMKSTVAAQAMAMILLKRAGIPISKTIRFISCADEEADGALGFGWMAKHHPDLLKAQLTVNEGGGVPVKRSGRLIYPIAVGEKGRWEIHIQIKGRGFHAASPWLADSAIDKAEEILRRIRGYQPEVSVDVELFQHLDTLAGISQEVTVDNLGSIMQTLEKQDAHLAALLRASSRMTLVTTMINAGVKSNNIAENCLIICDARTLPWQDRDYVRQQVEGLLEGLDGVRVEVFETAISNSSPYDSAWRATVERSAKVAVGRDDLEFYPMLCNGYTDSRFVRPLGNIAYGIVPAHPDDDPDKDGTHNINESVGIKSLMTATRFFTALAYGVNHATNT